MPSVQFVDERERPTWVWDYAEFMLKETDAKMMSCTFHGLRQDEQRRNHVGPIQLIQLIYILVLIQVSQLMILSG